MEAAATTTSLMVIQNINCVCVQFGSKVKSFPTTGKGPLNVSALAHCTTCTTHRANGLGWSEPKIQRTGPGRKIYVNAHFYWNSKIQTLVWDVVMLYCFNVIKLTIIWCPRCCSSHHTRRHLRCSSS